MRKLKIMVINGPNLNMLGIREPDIYGRVDYHTLVRSVKAHAKKHGITVVCKQSNHEGDLVDLIQSTYKTFDGIVINPGAYTHTSIALLDAVKAVGTPTVEIHISDPDTRESFRSVSYVRKACIATVKGEGTDGYLHAIDILCQHISTPPAD